MLAFTLTPESAQLFFEMCQEVGADTLEKRYAVLNEMAQMGLVQNIVQSKKTPEEYINHLAKHFKVLKLGD